LRSNGVTTGLSGIMNAADIYNRVEALKVPKCRVLFASTGVKGDEFRASYYIDELLAPNSVNTAPIATIDAYVAGNDKSLKLPLASSVIVSHQQKVIQADVDMDRVIDEQIREGLEAFKVAFTEILNALE
ncbi:transaldolase family protein, partial [uncultured Sulfuricurvum sp.]|uniref:transaldolase family protein n=1 Tax=uncultured Sulfuricurvum sp. TaxID=430693 RepID=UPI00260D6932